MAQVPIFVISHNRLAPLRSLVEWLESAGHERVIIIDNASTYAPLLEYLESSPHSLVRLSENIGHRSPWESGAVEQFALGQWYVVTDPDVVPIPECPKDAVDHFRTLLLRYPAYQKAGFGLLIDDLPDHYAHRADVVRWERQFWRRKITRGVYQARTDTTFALYRPFHPSYVHTSGQSIRTGFPYLARHLPWYSDTKNLTPEEIYYRDHCRPDVNNWGRDDISETARSSIASMEPWTVRDWLRWRVFVATRLQRAPVESDSDGSGAG